MFKSIEYKLFLFLGGLVLSVAAATWCFLRGESLFGVVALSGVLVTLNRLYHHYRKFNLNILFLLNALENGDYSFHFSTTRMSRRERELNRMLNRIKEILEKAREEVMANERFLSVVVESVSTGILIADDRQGVRIANRAALRMLGMQVLTHLNQLKSVDVQFPSLFAGLHDHPVRISVPNEREEMQISLRATQITLQGRSMRVIALHNIGSDLEAQEMDSWIKLIRVMTHEIMNSIAPITSLSDTALFSLRTPSGEESLQSREQRTIEALTTIGTTARGLLSFVESYRGFTGIPHPQRHPVALAPLLEKVVTLEKEALSREGVEIALQTERMPGELMIDESQITRVLVNLIKNAGEAMRGEPEGAGRSLILYAGVSEGSPVIEVRNSGPAIPPEVLPHIFVPFFTTKPAGSGIGLSISRYIMRLHGGNLKYYREEGWTVFRLLFAL